MRLYIYIYIKMVLEIDFSAFVHDWLLEAYRILASNAVISIHSVLGLTYARHIDWWSLGNIYLKTQTLRIKCQNFIDKVEDKIPGVGEQPRPGLSLTDIQYYENLRDEGYRLLALGDAKLRAFNWDMIIDSPNIDLTNEEAVDILMKLYQTIA